MKKTSHLLRRLLLAACVTAALCAVCFAHDLAQNVGTVIWENGVILRDAPSTTAKPLRIAKCDDTVIILEKTADGEWYRVKYNLLNGYMRADTAYIMVETEEAESRDLGRGMPTEGCNLRAAPSADAPIVRKIPANTQLEVIGLSGNWYRILFIDKANGGADYEGYIRSDLVCLTETPGGNSPGLFSGLENTRAYRAIEIAKQFLGMPYIFGAKNPNAGFDCSGLVQYVADQLGMTIARTAQTQSYYGTPVSYDNLQVGDLVFFVNTYNCPDLITHVGFYVGDGQFLHAGGDHVQISNLSHPYYASRFYTARRFF